MMKPIPNHDGYFADELGNIYSNKAKGGRLRKLNPGPIGKNKKHLRIMFSGDRKSYRVHRIIYETFNGPIPKGALICHKDDNPYNNAVSNLYAGTPLDNRRDAVKNNKAAKGEMIASSVLTEKDVKEILSLQGEMRNVDIARKFNINKCTITDIFKNRTWKHVKREIVK